MKHTDTAEHYGKHEANKAHRTRRAPLLNLAGVPPEMSPHLSYQNYQECSRSRLLHRGEQAFPVDTRHGQLYTSELFQYLAYVKSPSRGPEAEES